MVGVVKLQNFISKYYDVNFHICVYRDRVC
jgi:hypothetical protein